MAAQELTAAAILRELNTRIVGRAVRCYATLPSTQDVARQAAQAGAAEGAVFIADEQTAGRGRLGRTWQAPPGSSLLLSVVVRPSLAVYPKLAMIASLATALAIEEVAGLRVALKWPNDVLLNGKKVAGILVEGELQGAAPLFAAVGIGINVNFDPRLLTGLLYPATSLSAEVGAPVSRLALARSLLRSLDRELLGAASGQQAHTLWRARLVTLGRQVRISLGKAAEEGVAEDVDADGSLLLRRADGSLATIVAGEVTLQA